MMTMMTTIHDRVLKDNDDGGGKDNNNNNNNNYNNGGNGNNNGNNDDISNNNSDNTYEDGNYHMYETTTIDPSPWTFVVCISLCTVLAYLLPLLLAVRNARMKKQKNQRSSTTSAGTTSSSIPVGTKKRTTSSSSSSFSSKRNTIIVDEPNASDDNGELQQQYGSLPSNNDNNNITPTPAGNNNNNNTGWYFTTERPTEMILYRTTDDNDDDGNSNDGNNSRGSMFYAAFSSCTTTHHHRGRQHQPTRSQAYGDLFGGMTKNLVGNMRKRKQMDDDDNGGRRKKRTSRRNRRKKKRARLMTRLQRMGSSKLGIKQQGGGDKSAVLLTYVHGNDGGRQQQMYNAANEDTMNNNPFVDSDNSESWGDDDDDDDKYDEDDVDDRNSVRTGFASKYTVMTDDGNGPRPPKKEDSTTRSSPLDSTPELIDATYGSRSGRNNNKSGGDDDDDDMSDCTMDTWEDEQDALTMVVNEIGEFMNDVDQPDDISLASGWEERYDANTGTTYYVNPTKGLQCPDRPVDPVPDRNDINLCGGPRPWYFYYCSGALWKRVGKCLRYDSEMKKIANLAIPYTANTAFSYGFSLVETAFIGRLLGMVDLAAYFAVGVAIDLATMLLTGSMSCLSVLISQAIGADNKKLAGTYVQLSVWTFQVCYIPFVVYSWNRFDSILSWMGFDEETAHAAERYAPFALVYQIIGAFSSAIGYVLEVDGHEKYSAIFNSTWSAVSVVLVGAVSIFFDTAELWMIGSIHLGLLVVFLVINVTVILWKGWFSGYWLGMVGSNPFAEWLPVRTFFKNAAPLAFGYVIAYCEWDLMYLFAARQGPAEVAVWGLLGGVWGMTEGIVQGISSASGVRVARLVGSGRPDQARYSAEKALVMGIILSMIMASVLGLLQYPLPKLFTKDETLQSMFRELMPLVCLAVFLLSAGNIAWSVLCAQGRTHVATTITALGSLAVSIPLAFVSNHVFHYNLSGLVAAIIIGYTLSGYLNTALMITTNWTRVSDRATKRNRKSEKAEEEKQKKAERKKRLEEKNKKVDP